MLTPALPSSFFRFPLPNMAYSYKVPKNASPFTFAPDIRNRFRNVIDYHWSQLIPCISYEGYFDSLYPRNTLIRSLHCFSESLLKLESSKKRLKAIGVEDTMTQDSWYRICVSNVFEPSEKVMRFIRPYLDRMNGHYVIGMHLRMGGKAANWVDNSRFITTRTVTYQFATIAKLLHRHPNSVLFLSTDSNAAEKMIRNEFGDAVLMVTDFSQAHVGKKGADEGGVIRSLMDLYLLGQCDYLFLTRNSGFSRIGLAYNRKNPVVVYL